MDFVVFLQPDAPQPSAQFPNQLLILNKREKRVWAQFKIRPLFIHFGLLPINRLFHFLSLFVSVEDRPRSDTVCIAKFLSGVGDDIVNCSDGGVWLGDEAIFAYGVPPREGFTVTFLDIRDLERKRRTLLHSWIESGPSPVCHGGHSMQ